MKNLERLVSPGYAEAIATSPDRRKRREEFRNARQELYRLAQRMIPYLREHGIDADVEAFREMGPLSEQQVAIFETAIQSLRESAELTGQAYGVVQEQIKRTGDPRGAARDFYKMINNRPPRGNIYLFHNEPHGVMEVYSSDVADLQQAKQPSHEYQQSPEALDEAQSLWGDTYPVAGITEGVVLGRYRPLAFVGDTDIAIPVITIGPYSVETTQVHELHHHLYDAIEDGVAEHTDTIDYATLIPDMLEKSEKIEDAQAARLLLEDLTKGFLEIARNEIITDYNATKTFEHVGALTGIQGYDFFYKSFADRMPNLPQELQAIVREARDTYFDLFTSNVDAFVTAYEHAESQEDRDVLVGLISSTPLWLWGTRLRRLVN